MGFWDGFTKTERVAGDYIKKQLLAATGETFIVAEVIDEPNHTYNGEAKPRFLLKGITAAGKEGLVSIEKGYTRDDTVAAIASHVGTTGEPVPVKFVAVGSYIDIDPA